MQQVKFIRDDHSVPAGLNSPASTNSGTQSALPNSTIDYYSH